MVTANFASSNRPLVDFSTLFLTSCIRPHISLLCRFWLSERAFQVREKVLAAANWGPDNYLIVKENYIAEQIAPHVNINENCFPFIKS